jgi:hypothetical protein
MSALWRKLLHRKNSSALLNSDKLIGHDISHCIHLPAGPPNFEQIYFPRFAEPEVNSQIALRKVAAATSDFINLPVRFAFSGKSRDTTHTRANSTAVRFRSNQLQLDPIIT